MPFRIKLKKSRQYNVVSKALFVISVEMLDGTNIECTLSSESTGQDCLTVVCQKLSLNQPHFFGLQYVSRNVKNSFLWLELDRPLKRQLDKYASNLYVYLRVMYYIVSGVQLLNDEVTRYYYFLQLKTDVIDGRIACNPQQAVELASYSLQAEFGNFDSERHTAHYLKDFQLFPKSFTDLGLLATLTEAASRQHAILHNLPQGTAEEYYICACQRLDSYGQELFNAADRLGHAVAISVALTGVTLEYVGEKTHQYCWTDIKNVINHKRDFSIETVTGDRVEFQFSDAICAKNAWRFCVLQHTFYRQYELSCMSSNQGGHNVMAAPPIFKQTAVENSSKINNEDMIVPSPPPPPHHQQQQQQLHQQQLQPQWTTSAALSTTQQQYLNNQRAQSTSCLDLNKPTNIDHLRSLLPSYRPAPDYETAVQQHKYRNSASALPTNAASAAAAVLPEICRSGPQIAHHHHPLMYSSQPEIHRNHSDNVIAAATHLHFPDVLHHHHVDPRKFLYSGGDNFVPYNNNNTNNNSCSKMPQASSVYHQPMTTVAAVTAAAAAAAAAAVSVNSNSTPDLARHVQQLPTAGNRYISPFVSSVISGSSPDLVTGGNFYLKHQYPSYLQQQQQSTPPHVHRSQSYIPVQQHGTYENLPSVFSTHLVGRSQRQALIVENPNITKHIKKVYDEHGNIIYCMPANMKQILHENLSSSSTAAGFVVTTNADKSPPAEPIYENVPLKAPADDTATALRQRSHSVQSVPDVHQVLNHSVVNALHCQMQQLHLEATAQQNGGGTEDETDSPKISRSNTFIVNNEIEATSLTVSVVTPTPTPPPPASPLVAPVVAVADAASHEQHTTSSTLDASSTLSYSSTSSSTKSKKRRWGILMRRSKSSEKMKSATLDRQVEHRNNDNKHLIHNNNKNRWSTGLPRFNPLPPSISKDKMCQLLENKLADTQLFFEFDRIPKRKDVCNFSTALHPDNAAFNRFKDVLPYEENRVRLTPTKGNKHGYINASHITATVGSKQRFYIAAQGPSRASISHFWQCVWEAEVYLIVQLTDATEDIAYMPNGEQRCIDVGTSYQVWWEFSQQSDQCTTSKVRLCHVASRRYRTLWHLHYSDWGEQGCPNSLTHFLQFLEEMQSVYQHSMVEIPPGHNKNPPILIHCTAGVGRTGLTIISDLLLYTVDHNQEVCIPRVVETLRHQRAFIIQTIAQYRFIYSLLIHYLKKIRLI